METYNGTTDAADDGWSTKTEDLNVFFDVSKPRTKSPLKG